MQVLGIVGGDPEERHALADRLVDRLGERGAVARIERSTDPAVEPTDVERPDPAGEVLYRVDDDGRWEASGSDLSVGDALDEVAPDHDYAVLTGFPDADVPLVALDGREEALLVADSAAAVDVEEVVGSLEGTEPHETLESLVARAKRSPDSHHSGAIATFTGRVRAKDGEDDAPTEFLEFEKYEGVADERMATISEELESRDGVFEVVMHHRTGVVEAGEDIVFVVVLAGHREEAFRAVEDGINRLKDEVPFFKREVTVEEEFWVHQRE